ncbi:MAG: prolyl oligopeptidase family serine peptidase [Acidimicrobiales bacterium]
MAGPPSVATRRGQQVDDYHGELVADPYRWLEDTGSEEVRSWIEAQNELTGAFLARLPAREEIRSQLTELWDYPKRGAPFERGGRWFQERNSGLQDQPVLYVLGSPGAGEGRVLLDPNPMSADGTVSVPATALSEDGSLLAYATSAAGSDWMTWRVREVASGLDRPDVVEWSKYGSASWLHDGSGFYYSATERPRPGDEYTAQAAPVRIFFHRLGTPQAEDGLVFEAPGDPEWIPEARVSEDGRYLVVTITVGTAPESRIVVADLDRADGGFTPLVDDFSSMNVVVTNVGATFFLLTDSGAERQRIVAVDLDRAGRGRPAWREVVAETGGALLGARNCGGRIVCHCLEDACSRLSVFGLDGSPLGDLALPPVASVPREYGEAGVEGRAGSNLVHFELRSFTDPGTLWSYDVASGETRVLHRSAARFDPEELRTEQVFVTASDGARIPLFLTRHRDVEPSGEVPVLLYGYGGFKIPVTPDFVAWRALFAARGGLLAVAVLRGGGEYGGSWHDAGRLAHKQRVFDDFCDCARWLVSSGWSKPQKIAITGRSNGGLLVGACLTQHPELFGATVPEVGVMDMLRFHKFTIGWAWKSDFGDPDDPGQYRWVRAYSPLHNIKEGTCYPPTLVTTGDHDDRVVPGHSFKFAAALQAAQAPGCEAPVLVRVETSAGHGQGKPTSKLIAERADVLAFVEAALGAERAGPGKARG